MSSDGGAGAHCTCIPVDQNQGQQGERFRKFEGNCGPSKGDCFIVRMKGGCNLRKRDTPNVTDMEKRQVQMSNTTFEASSNKLSSIGNSSFIYIPFQDLRNGHYNVEVRFEGSIEGISVIDSEGDTYFTFGPTNQRSVGFDVNDIDDEPLPAALIIDTTRTVNVSFKATITPSNATVSQTPSGAGSVVHSANTWLLPFLIVPMFLA